MTLRLGNIATPPVGAGLRDVDVPSLNFESPMVHGADTAGAGSRGALAWQSRSLNRPGHILGMGAWNRSTAVNFNASSAQLGQVAPPGGV